MNSRSTQRRRKSRRDGGFTLVEVLIALIVLSIGMLGIAALYLDTLRASRSALYRTEAVTLAADLADRIRANRPRNLAEAATGYSGTGFNAVAIAELADWQAAIATQLPGGTGTVTYRAADVGFPSQYTISVGWTEVGQDDPSTYDLQVEI